MRALARHARAASVGSRPTCHRLARRRARVTPRARVDAHGAMMMDDDAARRRARVAVVGAGAAGLAAVRQLTLEGHVVHAYESAACVGGTWAYSEESEDDALGTRASRRRVHGSMYASLRTNLPREVMGFREFPFREGFGGDDRRFCGHEEVQEYLRAYAREFGLTQNVRFGTRVVSVDRVAREDESEEARWSSAWNVTSVDSNGTEAREMFDAVVVCNGHYSEPRVPKFDGAETWPGQRVHSHNYRKPDAFAGKTVLLIGAMASGEDISREIAGVAETVYLSARSWQNPEWANSTDGIGAQGNIFRKSNVKSFGADGTIVFEDGSTVRDCDVCMFCTGYEYRFDFLSKDVITVTDNHVAPLYEHCVAATAPSLSFVGLPWKVVPFPMFELQSAWIARMLSGAVPMPSQEMALRGAAELEATLEPRGVIPRRHAHCFGDVQFDYNDRIARMARLEPLASWRARMYKKTGLSKRAYPEEYRDVSPSDAEELLEARGEFAEFY